MICREKLKKLGENLLLCQFIHHESHVKSPGIEPKALW
jgi:hypothetical protein